MSFILLMRLGYTHLLGTGQFQGPAPGKIIDGLDQLPIADSFHGNVVIPNDAILLLRNHRNNIADYRRWQGLQHSTGTFIANIASPLLHVPTYTTPVLISNTREVFSSRIGELSYIDVSIGIITVKLLHLNLHLKDFY